MRRPVSLLFVLALTGAVAGCGDDGAERVSPDEWASAVCGSFGDFLTGVNGPVEDLVGLIQNPGTDEAQLAAQAALAADAFARFGEELDTIVQAIEDAGIPDVEGGEEFRDRLVGVLSSTRPVVEDARQALEEVEGGSTSVEEVTEVVNAQFAEFNAALDEVDFDFSEDAPPEVLSAYEDSPTCAGVRSRFESQE